jgi:hypothetical protein
MSTRSSAALAALNLQIAVLQQQVEADHAAAAGGGGGAAATVLRPDRETLRERLLHAQREKDGALADFYLAKNHCTALADQAAALLHSSILLGDYTTKLARQNYVTTKQDALISRLVYQRVGEQAVTRTHTTRNSHKLAAARHHPQTHAN